MSKRMLTGNDAVALGALHAGVKVVSGYPGTPSTGTVTALLEQRPEGVYVEWSTNEKVALEVALGASWAGQRALCTMKVSGLNVAYDTLIAAAYSGCIGGLVIYVADDPGANAGTPEGDSRGFALMADLPMLEPSSVAETYHLTRAAFEISECAGTPVFVRLVTAVAHSRAQLDAGEPEPNPVREAALVKDIDKYTKAGAVICMTQHRDLIERLARAAGLIETLGLNSLACAPRAGGLGILSAGAPSAYLDEALETAARYGFDAGSCSVLRVAAVTPRPAEAIRSLLRHCGTLLVLEELEPHLEEKAYVEAQRIGFTGRIVGKVDGTLSRIGQYGVREVLRGLAAAAGLALPEDILASRCDAEKLAADRPIIVCAGCPHRGTYLAINAAIRKAGYKRDEILVTGDIGCTILGMNPPFDTIWTEVSMGASVGLAQGYVHGGIAKPVIATMGDSTFFHAGMPALVNAVQHETPLTLIVMDNGWTAMTGMQVNPGTTGCFQPAGGRRVDLAQVIQAFGVDHFAVMDPFDLAGSTALIQDALGRPGVKVLLARQECVIQAMRRDELAGTVQVVPEKCNACKLCIIRTGCPAITLSGDTIVIDETLCSGCTLCAQVCNRGAILGELAARSEQKP